MIELARLADEEYCYVTTTGRVTGVPHEIEIWFALDGATVYLLSGGGDRSDWVRNLLADPAVDVRLGGERLRGIARVVEDTDEDQRARALVADRYQPGYGGDLTGWRQRALPIAIDLDA